MVVRQRDKARATKRVAELSRNTLFPAPPAAFLRHHTFTRAVAKVEYFSLKAHIVLNTVPGGLFHQLDDAALYIFKFPTLLEMRTQNSASGGPTSPISSRALPAFLPLTARTMKAQVAVRDVYHVVGIRNLTINGQYLVKS